ncbi:MAG: hypothetical protein KC994_16090 [Candidatus Omnitrophica bacterium]|nr:hypothetical protein [Candidatus Omnitrophota bacterium]
MDDPNILKIKHGGGFCLTLFGLPFFAAGVFAMVSPFIPGINWEGGEPPPLYFIIPFGSIFAVVGGAIMFGRAGVEIDARRNLVTTWWGFLVPFKYKSHSLTPDTVVSLIKVRKKSDDSSYWSYEVKLEGDFETIDVEENRDWFKSRQRAEQVAKLLYKPLVDRSQGGETITQPEDLDKPLNQKLQESGIELDLPAPPANYRTKVDMKGEGVQFKIPPPGLSPLHAIQVFGLLVLYVFMWFFFFRHFFEGLDDAPMSVALFFYAFGSIFFILPGLGVFSSIFRDLTQSCELEADPSQLKIVTRKYFIGRQRKMRMSQIEDVSVNQSDEESNFGKKLPFKRFIRVVSDEGQVTFGQGLAAEELDWIRDVLRYLISKGT